jgi:chemotaxis protein CheX
LKGVAVLAAFPLSVYRTDLAQIVVSVFQTMLNLEIAPADVSWTTKPDTLTAAIYFAGTWKGAVLLECNPTQAFEFTHRLMAIDLPACINDDVRDTMGELANMLAGNLKSVLPHGIGLSMPSVVEGTDYSLRICGGNLVDRMPFSSEKGVIWVTLIEVLEHASE